MPRSLALLDSNVILAAVTEAHEHHLPSVELLDTGRPGELAVAAHSYADAFSSLTRRGGAAPFQWQPDEAWAALESVAAITTLVGLTPAQSFDAVRNFAAVGGIGARLYDHLIGRAAVTAGASMIVTWNTGHLRSLFPDMDVQTPAERLRSRREV